MRRLVGVVLIAMVLAAGIGYVGWRARSVTAGGAIDLARTGSWLYVDGGRVRQSGEDQPTGPACQRAYAAGGTLACLRATAVPMSAELEIHAGKLVKTLPVWGDPSRVRVSPSGRLVAWTVFRTGDSYLVPGAFATTAGIYDLRTGAHHGSLEDFTAYVDGRPYRSIDVNYWGVTFLRDDRTFYATMSSKGRTWLMRGDLAARRLVAVRTNVECPSLSPDQTRIAYKYRTGSTWRLHVLDLATGADHPLAEPVHVDDQPAWLDDRTVAYSKNDGSRPAVFTVPADGSGSPARLFDGSSPAAL